MGSVRCPMVGVLNLQMGNMASVVNAIDYCGCDHRVVDASTDMFSELSHLIIPGVGHFEEASKHLFQTGLAEKIEAFAVEAKPIMGICLGMQLLGTQSEETSYGAEHPKGLNLIPGSVQHMSFAERTPHIGWNDIHFQYDHPVTNEIKSGKDFYFVHSYCMQPDDHVSQLALCDYGRDFAAMIVKDNIIGLQFHPEKSQRHGLKMLENFCFWDGLV